MTRCAARSETASCPLWRIFGWAPSAATLSAVQCNPCVTGSPSACAREVRGMLQDELRIVSPKSSCWTSGRKRWRRIPAARRGLPKRRKRKASGTEPPLAGGEVRDALGGVERARQGEARHRPLLELPLALDEGGERLVEHRAVRSGAGVAHHQPRVGLHHEP